MELVDFLRAQLDEDARLAEAASGGTWDACNPQQPYLIFDVKAYQENRDLLTVGAVAAVEGDSDRVHIARHDPARVLAEVEARRALLDGILAEPHATLRPGGSTEIYCDADSDLGEPCECGRDARAIRYVCLLARPYRDHPDFDPAWLED